MMSSGLPAVSWASAPGARRRRSPPDRGGVQQLIAVRAVEAGDVVPEAPQAGGDRGARVTAVPVTRMRTAP
jgi:hypothetical protein